MREKGVLPISANFEPLKSAPLDARMIASNKDSLTLDSTWQASDGNIYAYAGMIVSVYNDPDVESNGIYRLRALPFNNIANWEKVASSGSEPLITNDYDSKVTKSEMYSTLPGILIPLYIYPSTGGATSEFANVISLARLYPKVPIYVIINPATGPGTITDGNYTDAIKKLKSAGVKVLGYVTTNYGVKQIGDILIDIDTWTTFYPDIDSIFLDDMIYENPLSTEMRDFYVQAKDYAHSKGLFPVIANPGSAIPDSYYDNKLSDIFVIHENTAWPTESAIRDFSYNADHNRNKRAIIVFGDNIWNEQSFLMCSKYAGLIFCNSDIGAVLPNPWDCLTSTLEDQLKALSLPYMGIEFSGNGILGSPLRLSGIITALIDSTTAIQFTKADGTPIVIVDTENSYVGIGTTTPSAKLSIAQEIGETIHLQRSSNDTIDSIIRIRKTRGTIAAPTATLNGDGLGECVFQGFTGNVFQNSVVLFANAPDNHSPTSTPGQFSVATTPIGSVTAVERFKVGSDGRMYATTTDYETLITEDTMLPNKKYVDTKVLNNNVLAGMGTASAMEINREVKATGLYTYKVITTTTNKPDGLTYGEVLTFGSGVQGSVQIAGGWTLTDRDYLGFRSLRDTIDNWWDWKRIYHTNYHPLADALTTARTITLTGSLSGSASFDGSANISISATITGNAPTASTLATARTINGISFNGSADINIGDLRGSNYISSGTEKPNNAVFGSGKLRYQMLSGTDNLGITPTWTDTLWISSYTGSDVKGSNLLIFSKVSDWIGFCRQDYDATAWGTVREIIHSGNISTQTVSVAETANKIRLTAPGTPADGDIWMV
jgi:hypothetical protein